jgi:large subunit ribosomal protein L6
MSRTGNKEINILNCKVEEKDNELIVTSTKGSLVVPIQYLIKISIEDTKLIVSRVNNSKKAKELHGLTRTLINNAIVGLTEGYSKNMFLQGIGYRVQKKGNGLEFSLGYSHPVFFELNESVSVSVEGTTKFTLTSVDKQLIGQVCANIKSLRKRDPYKGKGIFFEGEVIKKKPGKSVK